MTILVTVSMMLDVAICGLCCDEKIQESLNEYLFDPQVEEDLLAEKYKIKKISDDLNQTFEDMINMSV